MSERQAKRRPFNHPGWRKLLMRVAGVVCCALIAGWVLQQAVAAAERQKSEAGFPQGMLHGALMPCALPHLLMGRDVRIFAENNTGRTYKLGYTVGVNGCGAVFFGLFFWRVNRWRRGLSRVVATTGYVATSDHLPPSASQTEEAANGG